MLIDVNAYIGHWPFRRLPHNTAEALVRQMDRHGIDLAVVASLHGAFYKNAHAANEGLAEEIRPFGDRLAPVATLNPTYPGWREDLRRCAEELGLRGIRLYPQYHGYALTDPEALELIDAATELGWTVGVPMRLVDRRQRHLWDLAADLRPRDLAAALEARPEARWMILSALGLDGKELPRNARFLIEISRMDAVLRRNIQGLLDDLGPGRLAFGTGMAFKTPEPALLKLRLLDVSEDVRDRIAWRNAAEMMGLEL